MYIALLAISFILLYTSKTCLIFILRDHYKDIYTFVGSPSMLSQYPFFVFGLMTSPHFKRLTKVHKRYAYAMVISMVLWSVCFVLAARSLSTQS
jgi:hypothetical protein